jgi:hypothetical protein
MIRVRRVGAAAAAAVAVSAAAAGFVASAPPQGRSASVPARAPESRRTLLAGTVAFSVPAGWVVQEEVAGCGSEGVAITIPCAPLDGTPHSADVNLLAEPNAGGEGLAAWSVRRFAVAAPRTIVEERVEDAWRTVISAGEDHGARYVVVERFGATPLARVHAVAAFPTLAEMGEDWLARAGADVDRFLSSLALAGAPPSRVRVVWDGRTARLEAAGAAR